MLPTKLNLKQSTQTKNVREPSPLDPSPGTVTGLSLPDLLELNGEGERVVETTEELDIGEEIAAEDFEVELLLSLVKPTFVRPVGPGSVKSIVAVPGVELTPLNESNPLSPPEFCFLEKSFPFENFCRKGFLITGVSTAAVGN